LITEYQPQTSNYYYYASDQVNSSRVVTDSAGGVVYSVTHTPFGDTEREFAKSFDPNPKFSGKEREGYSKWDYFGARYFDSGMYRFTSVDPVINKKEALSNPQLWNLYAYCANNPITHFDPDGRDVLKSISNWWNNAPIRLFLKGDFKGGLKLLGKNLFQDLSNPKFALGFVGGIKFTKGFKPGKWLKHYEIHGNEFPYKNSIEYLRGAFNLANQKTSKNIFKKLDPNSGTTRIYNKATNEFISISSKGYLKTYFKPKTGFKYFKSQPGKIIK